MLLGPDTEAFLHTGCALIVGLVSPDNEPHATRGWGLTVLHDQQDDAPLRVRFLVDANNAVAVELLGSGCAVAVTAADVKTLRSLQMKGHALEVQPATDEDRAMWQHYSEQFFDDIEESDRTPRALLERFSPVDVVAGVAVIDELFDQTPGPGAGGRLRTGDDR